MYALCVSGAVNTQGFVWKFFMHYISIFIHSFIHNPCTLGCFHKLFSVVAVDVGGGGGGGRSPVFIESFLTLPLFNNNRRLQP